MRNKKTKKAIDTSLDKELVNTTSQPEETANESEPFNFIKVFIEHIKATFKKFQGEDLSTAKNLDFIELGRTDEEKEQISEMCERVDEEYRLLAELRASGLSPEDWIKKKGDEILDDCTPEEREEIIRVVEEDAVIEVEDQTDALEAEVEDIKNSQNSSKENQ